MAIKKFKKVSNTEAIIKPAGNITFTISKPTLERGRNPQEYENQLKKHKINYKIFEKVMDGYLAAKQSIKENEMLFFGGSNFVVGEILENILEN